MYKQVIVMRVKFPDGKGGFFSPRKGKLVAQGSHASMAFLLKSLNLSEDARNWLHDKQAKVCLQVDTEEELLSLHQKALEEGLESNLITDAGLTEFKEPTITCIAIGPHHQDKINKITGHLKLL